MPQKLPIRHLLDVMHIERNICESLLKLLFGAKDTVALRRDMEEEGIREHLWIRRGPIAGGHYFKPPAPYVLKKEEQIFFWSSWMAYHYLRVIVGHEEAHYQEHNW